MAAGKWSTAIFDEDKRKALGRAHRRARQALGYRYRPEYAAAVGVSKEVIIKLEQGKPVSEPTIEAVGRFLPGWTEDTAVNYLEGGQPLPSPEAERTEADVTNREGRSQPGGGHPDMFDEMRYFREKLGPIDFERMLRFFDTLNESNRQYEQSRSAIRGDRSTDSREPSDFTEGNSSKAAG